MATERYHVRPAHGRDGWVVLDRKDGAVWCYRTAEHEAKREAARKNEARRPAG